MSTVGRASSARSALDGFSATRSLFVGDVDWVDSIELLQLRERALLLRDKVKRDTDALKSRADATRAEVDERLGRTNVILDEAQPPIVIRIRRNRFKG